MKGSRVSRRQVIASAGLALAGGALLTTAHRRRHEAGSPVGGDGATVILQGGREVSQHSVTTRIDGEPALVIRLEADPVRQWRGPQSSLLASRSTRLIGATTWPQFLIVRGLAEESGRRVRFQQTDGSTGIISWLIA